MYPVWEGIGLHSAMFVAVIASFHVVASHLTVGAAWFNLYLERRGVAEQSDAYDGYLRRSARGLLVFAYVFGAMAGVGIWQSTTAANPRGISTLIHNFVLFWGSEWYMFMIDVVGIIVYHYTFDRVDRGTRLRVAWILALGGTGTLSLIVGILGFKLSPGRWLETGRPLNGFYNPTFWPQYFMRFLLMQTVTAAYAIFIATRMPNDAPARSRIIRASAAFGLVGLGGALIIGRYWYFEELPANARSILSSRALPPMTFTIIFGMLILVGLYLAFASWLPHLQTRVGSLALLCLLFVGIFAAERTREVMRKPYIINGYLQSNQLIAADLPARGITSEVARLSSTGILGELPFVPPADHIRASDDYPDPEIARGRVIALQQCSACHSVSTQTRIDIGGSSFALRSQADILRSRGLTSAALIEPIVRSIGQLPYMPQLVGSDAEIRALVRYLEWEVDVVGNHDEPRAEGN